MVLSSGDFSRDCTPIGKHKARETGEEVPAGIGLLGDVPGLIQDGLEKGLCPAEMAASALTCSHPMTAGLVLSHIRSAQQQQQQQRGKRESKPGQWLVRCIIPIKHCWELSP